VIKRFGPTKTMFMSTLFNRLVAIFAYLKPTFLSPILLAFPSLTFGLFAVSESSMMQKEFSDGQRATMGSLNSCLGNIFFALFALGFGLVADGWGPTKTHLAGELHLLLLIPIY